MQQVMEMRDARQPNQHAWHRVMAGAGVPTFYCPIGNHLAITDIY